MKSLKIIYTFSKRVISMKGVKIDLTNEQQHNIQHNKHQNKKIQQAISKIPAHWQVMPFDQLCALPYEIIKALQLQVTKQKFSVNEDRFRVAPLLQQPQKQLNEYWQKIYKVLRLQYNISDRKIQQLQKNGDLSTMFYSHPFDDQNLLPTIEKFINNIRYPKQLEGIAEPKFAKYILGLRRDLLIQGADIDITYNQQSNRKFHDVKLIKVMNYEHEFWCDVSQNRTKNYLQDNYILQSRIIDNPNETLLLTEKYPKIKVLYITKKRKNKVNSMNFCHKIDILIEIEGRKHIIRVQKISFSKNFNQVNKKAEYIVVDFDFLMKGNPTIRPIFQF